MNRESGVYKITNTITGKCYIGSSINMYSRCNTHRYTLRDNKHHSKYLQRSYNKYGKENFTFEVLFTCSKEDLTRVEQYCINNYQPEYNSCKIAGSCLGNKLSEETKRKISIAASKYRHSEESKRKIAEASSKYRHTEEVKNKLSILRKQLHQERKDQYRETLHATRKLTVENVKDIKLMLNLGSTLRECSEKYNVGKTAISSIKSGLTWKDITI